MPTLLLAILFGALLWFGYKQMAAASPKNLAANLRKVVGVGLLILGVVLTLRGGLIIAMPIFFIGLDLLGLGHLAGIDLPFGNKPSPGQTSQVRTAILSMQLDHDSGAMSGEVVAGSFAGKQLAELSADDFVKLHDECVAAGDQSDQLLESYLDRMHPEWREGQKAGDNTAEMPGGDMSVSEARLILGVEDNATPRQIKQAHKRMMKQYHPDHGGSDYLAARINQARDLLLSR